MVLGIGKRWITRSNLKLKTGTVRVEVLVIVSVEDTFQKEKKVEDSFEGFKIAQCSVQVVPTGYLMKGGMT